MEVRIPYGRGSLRAELPAGTTEILTSGIGRLSAGQPGQVLVRQAMQRPIASPTLRELAAGKRTAVILISDHTRPVPSRDILPPMLEELKAGNPEIEVTLLVATGCHRGTRPEELWEKLGDEIYGHYPILVHDCERNNVPIGVLPSGAELVVDRAALECDLLVAEGFIEPHFFAGFSGGRKSVLPGICDKKTVMGNHCSAFLASPEARSGTLDGNPIHADMIAAARMAGLAYIINVILDEQHRTVAAFAGDAIEAHRAGCALLVKHCGVRPQRKGDIVVTSNGGAPLDQNLYQAVKGIVTAEALAAEGGTIVMCAACADGAGSTAFYEALRDSESAGALLEKVLAVPQAETTIDQWQYQMLVRVLVRHRVILVTRPALRGMVREMKMDYAPSLDEALRMAMQGRGPETHILAVPDGIGVIPLA